MIIRKAQIQDVPQIVEMLTNDKLGRLREKLADPIPDEYLNAFNRISEDTNQELLVLEIDGKLGGTMQLSHLQFLTYQGGIRTQIEAVRIREDLTGQGIGNDMIKWAIERAREVGAHVVQLTSDKERPAAIRFYKQLGFIASHEGMKLHLS